jgi:hypothetical protein
VKVEWVVAPELGSVTLDKKMFKQICYNLLANAVSPALTLRGGEL